MTTSKYNILNQRNYYINTAKGSHQLEKKIKEEKDFGIVVDTKLKFESHIYENVKKANRMPGLIKRSFQDLDKDNFLLLYKTMVRSQLKYGQAI